MTDHQSPSSWSSGESLTWWNAVEGYCGDKLAKHMFAQLSATFSPDLTEFESLIIRGANLEAKDKYGRSLLEVAKENEREDAVALLNKWRKAGRTGAHVKPTARWGEVY